MGYSRDTFYRFKHLYENGGEEALQELTRKKPNIKNRIPDYMEDAVIKIALDNPALCWLYKRGWAYLSTNCY
jgi:hypothetical protein